MWPPREGRLHAGVHDIHPGGHVLLYYHHWACEVGRNRLVSRVHVIQETVCRELEEDAGTESPDPGIGRPPAPPHWLCQAQLRLAETLRRLGEHADRNGVQLDMDTVDQHVFISLAFSLISSQICNNHCDLYLSVYPSYSHSVQWCPPLNCPIVPYHQDNFVFVILQSS